MADFYCQMAGTMPNGEGWSTARHITSQQTESGLANTWATAWTNAWNDSTHGLNVMFPTGLKVNVFSAATLTPQFNVITRTQVPATLAGTDTGDALPGSNSIVLSWRSAQLGRHYRGHQALPAPAESQTLDDLLNTAAIARVKAAIEAVRTAIIADGSTFFIVNKYPTSTGVPAGSKVVLTDVFVRNKIGHQTKRYRKVLPTYT